MGVHLVVGRAGSGKTHHCLSRIRAELESSLIDGPRLILLTPEQAALQMERALLAISPTGALGRCEVLSFRRLAYRVLGSTRTGSLVVLSPLGRQMALRYLIGRRRRDLAEFGKVADRPGFVATISRTVTELFQEGVSLDQVEDAAGRAAEAHDASQARLHDVALIYREYLKHLGSDRVDPEGVLDLTRRRLGDATWLDGCRLWIDGFAGLSRQQIDMVVALAQRAVDVSISLLFDPGAEVLSEHQGRPDALSLFARTERTWEALRRALTDAGVSIDGTQRIGLDARPRYAKAPDLDRLECALATGSIVQSDVEKSEGAHIRLVKAVDIRCEVEAAIRTVVDLVTRDDAPMRYRDIAIVVRNLDAYHDLISAGLEAHGIPFFIDRRRPTFHHPLVEAIRSAVGLHRRESFGSGIAALLKTGLTGIDAEAADALENYVLAHGLTTPASWDEEWTFAAPGMAGDSASSQEHRAALDAVTAARDALRRSIGPWWPEAGASKGRPMCRRWAERLFGLLERLDVPRQLSEWSARAEERGDLDEAAEHEQVWSDLMELLDEVTSSLGSTRMSARQFQEILDASLSEFTLGMVPPTLDQVLVGSIERSRHPEIRAALVLGYADGWFPASVSDDSVLGDEERGFFQSGGLTLGRTRAERVLDERMLSYIALTRAGEFLWVSYPEHDAAGRPMSPSPYWPWLERAAPGATVETEDGSRAMDVSSSGSLAGGLAGNMRRWCEGGLGDEAAAPWLSLYEWSRAQPDVQRAVSSALSALADPPPARLTPAASARLRRRPYRTSVTRLEQFAQCPFQHFAARGLDLEPRAEHAVSVLDMGRLYHRVMEQFVNELVESGRSLSDMSVQEIAGSLARLRDVALPQLAEAARIDERQRRTARRRSGRHLAPAAEGQRRSIGLSPLRPVRTELGFGGRDDDELPALTLRTPAGDEVQVRGQIDRVDLLSTEDATLAVVYDYKRSIGRRLRLDEVYHGLALQLMAYLLVVREHGRALAGVDLRPGGAFYLPLLAGYERIDDPEKLTDDDFGFRPYRPRGIVDFDWIDRLDPAGAADGGRSRCFNVFRSSHGGPGHIQTTDSVRSVELPALMDHVRGRMAELAGRWLGGDITVMPSQIGGRVPCVYCRYQSVCRIEYQTRQTRRLNAMNRVDVLAKIAAGAGDAGDAGDAVDE